MRLFTLILPPPIIFKNGESSSFFLMNCMELQNQLQRFLRKVPLYSPLKTGHSIIIKVGTCSFEIAKSVKGFVVNENDISNKALILRFKNQNAFRFIFEARSLREYGGRLVALATDGQVVMDPGPFRDPMKAGFYRFIGYLRKSGGLQTYSCIVPVI